MRSKAIRIALAVGLLLGTAAAGFLLSSYLGQDLVRREAEKQLTRILRGSATIGSARLVVGDGLWLKGRQVAAYPAESGEYEGLPVLTAERVAARLDVLALLRGRLRLTALEIDGLQLRLERFVDGSWSLPPLQALLTRDLAGEPADLERKLAILNAAEAVTRALLTRPLAAERVQLHYATVTLLDHKAGTPGGEPVTLHLRRIEARLEHDWLTSKADLLLRGQLTDSVGRRSDIEVSGRRGDGPSLTLAATDLPLSMLAPYLAALGPQAAADGTLSGVVVYRTPLAKHSVVELDWRIRNLDVSIPLSEEPLHIESSQFRLQSRIELHPGRLRLVELELAGLDGAGRLTASGVVQRPLRESSRAKLAVAVHNTGLAELRRGVSWLPKSDADPLTRLLQRLDGGHIELIEARGGAPISEWRRLVAGQLASLPAGFVLATDVADVAVASDGPAALTGLGAHAEWNGNRIALRQLKANWKGRPLPQIDATIHGVAHLLRGPAEARELRPGAEPLRGLGTLWSVLTGEPGEDPQAGAAPMPEMQLAVEALDHPALRWPIRNTQIRIVPTPLGAAIEASEGTWGGMPFHAEANWIRSPKPHWKLAISLTDPGAADASPATPAGPTGPTGPAGPAGSDDASGSSRTSNPSPGPPSSTAWFQGHIGIDSLEASGLPVSHLRARFEITGAELSLLDATAQLAPHGVLSGSLVVDLATPERLPVAVDAEMVSGELAQIAPLVGLAQDQWSGEVSFKTHLEGWVDPNLPLLAELSGTTFVLSRKGELRQEIPLLLALAQATEGFNAFASGGVARYDSVAMTLQLDRGRLSTDDLELEGPIRVYAEGFLDVARPNPQIDAVVGVFLFRQADRMLGRVPLLSHLISDKGLIGGYFRLTGWAGKPDVRGLPLNSIATVIPDVVKAPFRAIRALGELLEDKQNPAPPAKPQPAWPDSHDEWKKQIGHKP